MTRKLYTDGPPKPQDWELKDGWEKEVCRAVIAYPMSPREAKFILDVCGRLMQNGLHAEQILRKLDE